MLRPLARVWSANAAWVPVDSCCSTIAARRRVWTRDRWIHWIAAARPRQLGSNDQRDFAWRRPVRVAPGRARGGLGSVHAAAHEGARTAGGRKCDVVPGRAGSASEAASAVPPGCPTRRRISCCRRCSPRGLTGRPSRARPSGGRRTRDHARRLPRVSVVVPTYNRSGWLRGRCRARSTNRCPTSRSSCPTTARPMTPRPW